MLKITQPGLIVGQQLPNKFIDRGKLGEALRQLGPKVRDFHSEIHASLFVVPRVLQPSAFHALSANSMSAIREPSSMPHSTFPGNRLTSVRAA